MQSTPVAIKRSTDSEGFQVSLVPIVGSTEHVVLYTSDLDWLIANGYNLKFYSNKATCDSVKVYNNRTKRYVGLGRILLNAKHGQRVDFANKNNRDLRRSNLILSPYYKNKSSAKTRAKPPKQPIKQQLQFITEG